MNYLDHVIYEIDVSLMHGPDTAYNVKVYDILPAGMIFSGIVSIDQGTYNETTGIWDIGTMNPV